MQHRVRIKLCRWRAASKARDEQRVTLSRGLGCATAVLVGLLLIRITLLGTVTQAQEQQTVEPPSEKMLLEDPRQIPALLAGKKISAAQIPNPHWRKDGCRACHKKSPDKRGLHLWNANVEQGCNICHAEVSKHSYIHPSGMKPSQAMLKQMPAAFRKSTRRGKGRVTCITCHDLPMQCSLNRARERGLNTEFFRGGPYKARTAICYRCHDAKAYQRLNPHDQVDDKGRLRKDRCGVCHQNTDYLIHAPSVEEVDFNVRGDLSVMCTGCHQEKPHPGGSFSFGRNKKSGTNHLVEPSRSVLRQMKNKQRENKVRLPLDPNTGRVYCATCHDPHEKGVIKTVSVERRKDVSQRLRMKKLCLQCHDK